MGGAVNGNGDTDFGGGDDINGSAVSFKNFKDLAKEAGGQEHAGGFDLDGSDVIFGGDGLDFGFFGEV